MAIELVEDTAQALAAFEVAEPSEAIAEVRNPEGLNASNTLSAKFAKSVRLLT